MGRSRAGQRAATLTVLSDLEEFVADHRPHGGLTADAAEPAWNGYLLTVARKCGVTFMRWVTDLDAVEESLRADLRASSN